MSTPISYTPTYPAWHDSPASDTPITAAALAAMDAGIAAATAQANQYTTALSNYAMNASGVTDSVGAGVSYNPESCYIVIPATTRGLQLRGKLTVAQTAVGTGTATLQFVDFTNSVGLESHAFSLPNIANRLFTLQVSMVLTGPSTTRTIGVMLGLTADSGQTPALVIQNSVTFPSVVMAEVL